jgi:hypothetical protein
MLSVLQPGLSALGATGGSFRPETSRQFEKARAYYNLLQLSADELVKVVSDRPARFTPAEYLALLQVMVPGRGVTTEHRAQVQRITLAAAKTRAT